MVDESVTELFTCNNIFVADSSAALFLALLIVLINSRTNYGIILMLDW